MKKIFEVIFVMFFIVWGFNECQRESEFTNRKLVEKSREDSIDKINASKVLMPINETSNVNSFSYQTQNENSDFSNENEEYNEYYANDDYIVNEIRESESAIELIRVGAVCNDGTSSSATGSGACSHHGGVSYWIYE